MRKSAYGRPVAMWAAASVVALVAAGCGGGGGSAGGPDNPVADGASSSGSSPSPAPQVRMTPKAGSQVAWSSHPVFTARNGTITSVQLTRGDNTPVAGQLHKGDTLWRAGSTLVPDKTYNAVVQLQGSDGKTTTRRVHFKTGQAAKQLSMSAYPGPGSTYGVGQTIHVSFNRPVTDRAEVEKHMTVTTSRGAIQGGWHWFSDEAAHFRPRHFWPANTKVTVNVNLQDLNVGNGVWGDRNHDWSWQVGNSHISYVSATTHRFRVNVNGHQIANWPTGMGQPGFATRDGTYNILMKTPVTEMTSCSIGVACNKNSPNYYDLQVHDAVRITDSGEFVHAAPWDASMGVANTSHGCIHLSTTNAQQFYDMAVPGDVVIVTGTGRGANTSDPGMADWAIPWSAWKN